MRRQLSEHTSLQFSVLQFVSTAEQPYMLREAQLRKIKRLKPLSR